MENKHSQTEETYEKAVYVPDDARAQIVIPQHSIEQMVAFFLKEMQEEMDNAKA